MENLRETVELDLLETLEGEFSMRVELTTPEGQTQRYSMNDPDKFLTGQVLYFSKQENPVTGEPMIVNQPIVILRLSSLIREPQAGETWYIKFPKSPVFGAEMLPWVFTPDKSPEHSTDVGVIKIYPQKIEDT